MNSTANKYIAHQERYEFIIDSYITKSAIQKLAKRGGVRRLKGDVYYDARELIVRFLEEVLRRAYLYNDFRERVKLESSSVILALRSSKYDIKLVAGTLGDVRGNIVKMAGGGNKGKSELKEIKKLQASVKLIIPQKTFEKLCRVIIKIHLKKESNKVMLKKESLVTLQNALENYMIKVFDAAQLQAIHAKRITVEAEDLKMACANKDRLHEF